MTDTPGQSWPQSDSAAADNAILRAGRFVPIAVAALMFLTRLGATPLWDRDEPRNAGCAREMMLRGDWVVPTFNDALRTDKPILHYWLMIAAYRLFGDSEFTARLGSALLGIGTVLLTGWIGTRLVGPRVGFWSALILASSLMMSVAARIATPDSHLIFFTTATIAVFVRAGISDRRPVAPLAVSPPLSWTTTVALYSLAGCAVLAKGPVGYAGPVAIVVLAATIIELRRSTRSRSVGGADRRLPLQVRQYGRAWVRALRSLRVLPGTLIALAVASPWFVAVAVQTNGQWLSEFLLRHNLSRALAPMENHSGPFWYYLPAISFGFFPWSVFLIPLTVEFVLRIRRGRDTGGAWNVCDVVCLAWIAIWVGGFSLARTKLPSYVTPAYPPLAILTARYLVRWQEGELLIGNWMKRLPPVILLVSGVGMVGGVAAAASLGFRNLEPLFVLGLMIAAAGAVGLRLVWRQQAARATLCVALASVLFTFGCHVWGAVRLSRLQRNAALIHAIRDRAGDLEIASFGCLEPSWVWLAQQPIRELSGAEPTRAREFLDAGTNRVLITTRSRLSQLTDLLPDDVLVLAGEPYFLHGEEQLVVLGRSDQARAAPGDSQRVAARAGQSDRSDRKRPVHNLRFK